MLVHQRVCAVHVRARTLDRYARLKRRTVLLSLCLFFFVPPQVLIAHARTCPGHHASRAHGEVCKSVKYLMLHIRDCCGRTPDGAAAECMRATRCVRVIETPLAQRGSDTPPWLGYSTRGTSRAR